MNLELNKEYELSNKRTILLVSELPDGRGFRGIVFSAQGVELPWTSIAYTSGNVIIMKEDGSTEINARIVSEAGLYINQIANRYKSFLQDGTIRSIILEDSVGGFVMLSYGSSGSVSGIGISPSDGVGPIAMSAEESILILPDSGNTFYRVKSINYGND